MSLILIAVLGFILYKLNNRIVDLEKKINSLLNEQPSSASHPDPYSVMAKVVSANMFTPASLETDTQKEAHTVPRNNLFDPVGESRFLVWLKKDFLVKLGALIILLPITWFLAIMFENGIIGPVGQISLGLLLGVSVMWFGLKRFANFPHQGGIFTVLGSTIVLITVFVGQEAYYFFPPLLAFLVMALSVMFVSYVAIIYRSPNLALVSILLGAVVPVLTGADSIETLIIFMYLTLLVLGGLWILTKVESPYLSLCTLGIVSVYSLAYLPVEQSTVVIFGFIFTLIFFLSSLFSLLNRQVDKPQIAELVVATGSAVYVAFLIYSAIDETWHSLLFSAWALVFGFGSYIFIKHTTRISTFYTYSAVAIGFLAAATASELSGPVLYIVFTLEITALVLLTLRFIGYKEATRIAWFLVFPVIFAIESFGSNSWRTQGILHGDFVVVSLVTAVLIVIGIALYQTAKINNYTPAIVVKVIGIVAGIQTMAIIWLSADALLPEDQAIMISLLIYLVTGIASYVEGVSRQNRNLISIGIFLIGLVVIRLLLVDVWQMETTGRIITFLLVGILLISTAFMKKLQNK